jgi:hypothetical protein
MHEHFHVWISYGKLYMYDLVKYIIIRDLIVWFTVFLNEHLYRRLGL